MISPIHPPAAGAEDPAAEPTEGEPVDDGPISPSSKPRRRRRPQHADRSPSPWWRYGFPAAMVVLVLAAPVLAVVGARVVLDSNDGRLVNRVTDPAAPGWEAVLDATPTELILTVDDAGALQGAAVLILSGEGSGAVLQVPVDTVVEPVEPLTSDDPGAAAPPTTQPGDAPVTPALAYYLSGVDGVRGAMGQLLGLSFADVRVLTPADWAAAVEPVTPLTVNSPDAAIGPDGSEIFPRGSIQLDSSAVFSYLSAQGPGVTDLARLVRVEALWRSWLSAIGAAGMATAPQPVEESLGLFVGTLASEQVRYTILPVEAVGEDGAELYRADPEEVALVIGELVPFPEAPPGVRPTVRILDGTGRLDHGVAAAVVIGAAGGQVRVIGNATDFDVATTEIIYYDEARRASAEAVRDALGVGEVIRSEQKSPVDITVVLGADALGVPALTAATGVVPGVPLPEPEPVADPDG